VYTYTHTTAEQMLLVAWQLCRGVVTFLKEQVAACKVKVEEMTGQKVEKIH